MAACTSARITTGVHAGSEKSKAEYVYGKDDDEDDDDGKAVVGEDKDVDDEGASAATPNDGPLLLLGGDADTTA